MDERRRQRPDDDVRTLWPETPLVRVESSASGHVLPRYLTTFIGRREAIEDITIRLLRGDVRLLTLIGPGGSGKTRLVIEAVDRLPPGAWDDIWFIPLAALRNPDLVIFAIAQAVGVRQVSGRPISETLTRFLCGRRALLVIDNFEMVVAAGPELGRILAASPDVTMVVTSRIVLRVSGEHVIAVPPLDLPGGDTLPLGQLRTVESVQLFLERAKTHASTFTLTEENASVVVDICRRLDGLPLALELAAARSGVLSPPALLRLLEHQPGVLAGGPLDVPERHRSIRSAIAWSYELLSENEQAVFRALAVFSGGFSLDAANAVVDHPNDMLDTLTSLTSKSLITPVASNDAEPRFTMLETLREYGLERLVERDEGSGARIRHAAFFLEEVIQGEYAWCMPRDEGFAWLTRLSSDAANMRDALEWLDHSGDILRCMRLASALGSLWVVCGHLGEGQKWLERVLDHPIQVDELVRARALTTLGWISDHQNRPDKAFALAEQALLTLRNHDDPLETVRALVISGVAAERRNDYALAITLHDEALDCLSSLDGPDWVRNLIVSAQAQAGIVELMRGSIGQAEVRLEAAAQLDIDRGYEPGASHVYGNYVMGGLGTVARAKGDARRALHHFQKHLHLAWFSSNVNATVHAIADIAGTLAGLGHYLSAARLFGAAEALHESFGYDFSYTFNLQRAFGLPEPWAREGDPCGSSEPLRDALRPRTVPKLPATILIDALEAAWDEGRTLPLEVAVGEALAATADPAPEATPAPAHGLSPREAEVLGLVAEGFSNRVIADRLSLSERTVEHHVMHILTKLDLGSRTAAATYAVRHGLL